MTVAVTDYSGAALLYIALAKGFFEDASVSVTVQSFPTGKAALDAVRSGNADVATCSELAIAIAVLNGQPLAVLGTVDTGGDDYVLVSRRDRGVAALASLKGKRVAVTRGTSGEFFLDALLIRQQLSLADVKLQDCIPAQMADALGRGDVDAAATWEPFASAARARLGDRAAVFSGSGIYEATFNLVASQSFQRERGDVIRKLLRALVQAQQSYESDRQGSCKIIAAALGMTEADARPLLARHHFELSLDQTLILMMEDEARWAIRSNLVAAKTMPNFLSAIYLDGLLAVKPKAVTVIH